MGRRDREREIGARERLQGHTGREIEPEGEIGVGGTTGLHEEAGPSGASAEAEGGSRSDGVARGPRGHTMDGGDVEGGHGVAQPHRRQGHRLLGTRGRRSSGARGCQPLEVD